ncbi:uncharacterized protein EI90DRAFT_3290753 [Cantharellus anzutake]|uniref:uncharacterized protein n=1 Tax=Cantharellus anzutake TaxID=1750568 RepID=UPI001903F802|nr:uncharacterized protein EI90DRAFT_3290753 [Cantharellus anzutake]KAF8327882.1 hypothetical protein EI90DRAFT_3290753 [Cantharellus anzutake]
MSNVHHGDASFFRPDKYPGAHYVVTSSRAIDRRTGKMISETHAPIHISPVIDASGNVVSHTVQSSDPHEDPERLAFFRHVVNSPSSSRRVTFEAPKRTSPSSPPSRPSRSKTTSSSPSKFRKFTRWIARVRRRREEEKAIELRRKEDKRRQDHIERIGCMTAIAAYLARGRKKKSKRTDRARGKGFFHIILGSKSSPRRRFFRRKRQREDRTSVRVILDPKSSPRRRFFRRNRIERQREDITPVRVTLETKSSPGTGSLAENRPRRGQTEERIEASSRASLGSSLFPGTGFAHGGPSRDGYVFMI